MAGDSHAHADAPSAHAHQLAHHFESLAKQSHALRLGMWLFLATELLLFGALFVAYSMYRWYYPMGFAEASHHLDRVLGTVDTFVLITSSFTMAMALHWVKAGKVKWAVGALAVTVLLGFGFLGIHSMEYLHDIHAGALPGKFFRLPGVTAAGASMFFTLYYVMTLLHSLHVLVGVLVLSYLGWRTARGAYSAAYDVPLEMGGMYWHLVDLIWIFLYPLLYLI
jgi:cytochrome c oxidase subunit III